MLLGGICFCFYGLFWLKLDSSTVLYIFYNVVLQILRKQKFVTVFGDM